MENRDGSFVPLSRDSCLTLSDPAAEGIRNHNKIEGDVNSQTLVGEEFLSLPVEELRA